MWLWGACLALVAVGCAGSGRSRGAKRPLVRGKAPVDFYRDVQPILGEKCLRCHGGVRLFPRAPDAPLDLKTRETALRVLDPGEPDRSLLLSRVTETDPDDRMPKGGAPLTDEEVGKLQRWIAEGASWPRPWAFAPLDPIEPGDVPVENRGWVRTPIDRFILNRLEQQGLQPSAEADRPTLIRRVFLDLVGLPPTLDDVDAFVLDSAPDAYERLVDRLLDAPGFAERWARHWLDQARYADSDGYAQDSPRVNAWRWRDWVIKAFNDDMPFDQFTIAQIAGDLLPHATAKQRLATAFNTQTMFNSEDGAKAEEDRTKRVVDRVATVGQTWLGLTIGCAQCHNHPYDPISQREFYRLYAFFDNADESPPYVDIYETKHQPGFDAVNVLQERTASTLTPGSRMVAAVKGRRSTHRLIRGDYLNPDLSEALEPGTPAALHPLALALALPPALPARNGSADRLDLAHWLVDENNPLTPRVAVNDIWYHLFGTGIVASLDDFGSRGSLPSHPRLLDWLARDFVHHGWRRKRLIREIVTSATYRQSSAFSSDTEAYRTKDPDNSLLHRQNRLRVEAEVVWNLPLAVSGLLKPRIPPGGPSVFPPIPADLFAVNVHTPPNKWVTSDARDRYRRGLYTFLFRNVPYPSCKVFDRPDGSASVAGRPRSNNVVQALTMMHNEVVVEAAQAFARRIQVTVPQGFPAQLAWAFRTALARPPADDEAMIFQDLYRQVRTIFDANPEEAGHAVGDYLPPGTTPGAAAAWVATARAILNLDEFIMRQ